MTTVIVPVSGGKDSQVVLSLALAAGHKPVCVHQNTGFDHPDTYAHMRAMEDFYGVSIEHTHSKYKRGMLDFITASGYFPNTSARGCTQRLKQGPFAAWLVARGFNAENCEIWFGMRSDESAVRRDKYSVAPDDGFTLADIASFYSNTRLGGVGSIPCRLPIVHMDTDGVFAYLKAEGAPLNPLYGRGHHRVGCYPCLLARKAEWQAAARDPTGRAHLTELLALEDAWNAPVLDEKGQFTVSTTPYREHATVNPRKFIKVHRVWDIKAFLDDGGVTQPELADSECGYCSI